MPWRSSEHDRPDPDALLAQMQAARSARAARGRLRIYFGAIGRRRQDLRDAERPRSANARQGRDVVVGVVETHGRSETAALLAGLDVLPLRERRLPRPHARRVRSRRRARRASPALILVDELAHTNAPGSRHPKRWQDVEELLDAGIDVWSDTQRPASGKPERRRSAASPASACARPCPTRVFDEADEVVLVDLPPDELLARLAGRQGLPAAAGRARGAELLPQGQPDRVARARAAPHRRARRRRRAGVPRATRSIEPPVWKTEGALLACIGPTTARRQTWCARRAAGAASSTCAGMRSTSRRPRCSGCRRAARAHPRSAQAGRGPGRRDRGAGRHRRRPRRWSSTRSEHNCAKLVVGRRRSARALAVAARRWRERIGALAPDIDLIEVGRAAHAACTAPRAARRGAEARRAAGATLARLCLGRAGLRRRSRWSRRRCGAYFELANIVMLFLLGVVASRCASAADRRCWRLRSTWPRSISSSCRRASRSRSATCSTW